MLMAWDGFVAGLKGCFRSEFGLKNCIYESFQKALATFGHAIAWIGAIMCLWYTSTSDDHIFLV